MKKIVAFILLLCMVVSFAACGKVEITMQELYDAGQIKTMLQNHQSVYIRDEMDGEMWYETYLTEEYAYEHLPDEEYEYAQFMTNAASYVYMSGDYLRYLFIDSTGVTNDFTSDHAEYYTFALIEDVASRTIESVSKKDGRIAVTSLLSSEALEDWAEDGVTAGKFEYVLDAKSREIISATGDYTYNDGSAYHTVTEINYDAEAPEMLKTFLAYEVQTENLRNVTVVSNPGTEKEVSQEFQFPKGLIIGFSWDDAFADNVGLYADAACTEAYDPYAGTDSDLTIYVKWTE